MPHRTRIAVIQFPIVLILLTHCPPLLSVVLAHPAVRLLVAPVLDVLAVARAAYLARERIAPASLRPPSRSYRPQHQGHSQAAEAASCWRRQWPEVFELFARLPGHRPARDSASAGRSDSPHSPQCRSCLP